MITAGHAAPRLGSHASMPGAAPAASTSPACSVPAELPAGTSAAQRSSEQVALCGHISGTRLAGGASQGEVGMALGVTAGAKRSQNCQDS